MTCTAIQSLQLPHLSMYNLFSRRDMRCSNSFIHLHLSSRTRIWIWTFKGSLRFLSKIRRIRSVPTAVAVLRLRRNMDSIQPSYQTWISTSHLHLSTSRITWKCRTTTASRLFTLEIPRVLRTSRHSSARKTIRHLRILQKFKNNKRYNPINRISVPFVYHHWGNKNKHLSSRSPTPSQTSLYHKILPKIHNRLP